MTPILFYTAFALLVLSHTQCLSLCVAEKCLSTNSGDVALVGTLLRRKPSTPLYDEVREAFTVEYWPHDGANALQMQRRLSRLHFIAAERRQ